MDKIDKIIEVAEKLPGYYGYRPVIEGHDILITELQFRLIDEEKEMDYTIVLFYEEGIFTEGIIDVKFSDGSIVEVTEEDEDFKEIIEHKNKIIRALNTIR